MTIMRPYKYLFASCITLWMGVSRGFILQSLVGSRPVYQVGYGSYRPSLHVRCSMAIEKKSWKDLQEFNVALDQLAEQSGGFNQPVIVRAAECQTSWEDLVNDPSATPRPDTISFNTVLKAWNRCCYALVDIDRNPHRHRNHDASHSVPVYTPRDAAERATTLLLRQMEKGDEGAKPDAASFNVVIDAWAKSRVGDAPQAAERLLKLMLDSDDVEPDTISYGGVLDAWSQTGTEESLVKVKQIFQHMRGLYDSGKNIKPTIRHMNSIISAHSKVAAQIAANRGKGSSEKAFKYAEDAHDLKKQMDSIFHSTGDLDFAPDVTTYSSVIDAYSRCGSYKATQEAENLLNELKQLYQRTKNQNLRPNVRTYTSLITCWARTRSQESPKKVEALLEEMADDPTIQPNSHTYTAVIQTWGKSSDHNKARHVLKVLREMQDQHKKTGNDDVRPNVLTYNAAMHACGFCQGTMEQQTEALKIAFAILKTIEIDEVVRPNQITYSTLLAAVTNLLPSGTERNQVAKAVFEKAKNAGLVTPLTMRNLRKAVDGSVMHELGIGNERIGGQDYNNIPSSWSKNVR